MAALLVFAGVAARLRHLATNRSLWLDEATLATNICFRPWWRLFGTLDFDQVAPVGFLLLEKAGTAMFGPTESALRLVPFLAGCAALPVTWALARRVVGPVAALLALAVVATCPAAIYYSAEVKQYSGDLFACATLLLVAVRHGEAPEDRGRFRALLAAGVLAPWFSHPTTFVLAAIGIALVLDAVARGARDRIPFLAMLAVAWSASFGLCWVVSLGRVEVKTWVWEF